MMEIREIEELIKAISKFPGLGPKSAKRIILKLINNKDEIMKPTINALVNVYKNISRCNYCGVLKSSKDECDGFNTVTSGRSIACSFYSFMMVYTVVFSSNYIN